MGVQNSCSTSVAPAFHACLGQAKKEAQLLQDNSPSWRTSSQAYKTPPFAWIPEYLHKDFPQGKGQRRSIPGTHLTQETLQFGERTRPPLLQQST